MPSEYYQSCNMKAGGQGREEGGEKNVLKVIAAT